MSIVAVGKVSPASTIIAGELGLGWVATSHTKQTIIAIPPPRAMFIDIVFPHSVWTYVYMHCGVVLFSLCFW